MNKLNVWLKMLTNKINTVLPSQQTYTKHQSFPAEYYKINTAIWKDQQEYMKTENVYYVQRNIYIYIYKL